MNCPQCNGSDTEVIDSRPYTKSVRRRRQCSACGHRFTTLETHGNTMKKLTAQRKQVVRQVNLLQLRLNRFLIVADSGIFKETE